MKISRRLYLLAFAMTAALAPIGAVASAAPAHNAVEIAEPTPTIKALPGRIAIDVPGDAPRHVTVYALTGQVVKQLDAPAGHSEVELPAGYFIVCIDNLSVRVVIK